MSGCENTPSDFTGMRIDTICECGHASLLHARTGCALCPFTDRLDAFMDLLETQNAATQIMHAHVENLIERMVVLSEDGFIRVDNLPPNIRSFISEKKIPRPTLTEEGIDLNRAVEEFEYRLIDEALRRTKGNKQAAARLLGLKRTTLVAKLRRKTGGGGEAEGYLI